MIIRQVIAGLAATLLALAPIVASAQSISTPGGNTFPLSGSCGTVSVSTPCLGLTQTWNAGGVTFTGMVINVTDTASSAASLLLDLQKAGGSQFSVDKFGNTTANTFKVATAASYQWASGDLFLARDAANTLALRNGVSAQTLNVYNTFTDASNYERGFASWLSNVYTLGTEAAGTGTTRNLRIKSANSILLQAGGNDAWTIAGASGNFLASTDNTYDIGATGANRPRNLFVAGSGTFGGTVLGSQLQTSAGVVSGLGAATAGRRATVTDATVTASGNFGAIVAGGGANTVPVWADGTNWRIG